ncbi:MAG: 2-succinyl-5-enolpyruvyl-6-hydroxy-3-cyclohexene-1-carboxylic-acid synthase [Gammaproteobacteria bacterium]|nr:2-succinyl-5-enolpyruvyl-6-hydroxy-3-cyclohexene-1-carboxylic-acid synthase [Gammaproteobacteria bacterium]
MENDNIARRNAQFAQQAISRLIAGGCAGVVISPGSRHTPLVIAVANAGVPTEVVLDERSAGFLALGWAKASRSPIALICTSGSAGAHYLPAVIEAWESGVPLLLITTDRPPEHLGIGAPQTTRQDGFYTNHVKSQFSIGAADEASAIAELEHVDELVALARAGKPGPVQLNIGFREPLWEAGPTPLELEDPARPKPGVETALEDALELPDATRGVLVVGPIQEALPDARQAVAALAALAQRRGWPVLADVASGLRQHPSLGPSLVHGYDLFLRSEAARAALRPELVLHAGRMPTSKTLFTWLQVLEDDSVDVLHLSTDGEAHSLGQSPRVVPTSWSQLTATCEAAKSGVGESNAWLPQWQNAHRLTYSVVDEISESAGLWEGSVAQVAARVSEGSTLVLGSGMPVRDADTYVTGLAPATDCLVNRGVNGIDGLLATAAGAALHNEDSPVRLLAGDQAFLHDIGSLAVVAGRPNLDIVVINNGGSGIFEFLPISQAGDAFEKYFLAPQRTDIQAAAEAFGVEVCRCESNEELEQFLDAPRQGPRIAEVMVDRAHNVYIHKQISAAVSSRLDQEIHLETSDGKRADAGGVESG